jgi:hypothetical protein
MTAAVQKVRLDRSGQLLDPGAYRIRAIGDEPMSAGLMKSARRFFDILKLFSTQQCPLRLKDVVEAQRSVAQVALPGARGHAPKSFAKSFD